MKKITIGSEKHKGNLPFKFVNYGKIGHFASKYPFAKTKDTNEGKIRSSRKGKEKKSQRGGKVGEQNKSVYSREDRSSNEEDNDIDTGVTKQTFVYGFIKS